VNVSVIVGILLTGVILGLIAFVAYQAKKHHRTPESFIDQGGEDEEEMGIVNGNDSFALDEDEPQNLDPQDLNDDDDNRLID